MEKWSPAQMMPEISLNILDVAQNSITAGSCLTEIDIIISIATDTLEVIINDNGSGMTQEQAAMVVDPFFTTRTTRKVGLGVPFLKMAAEFAGGHYHMESAPGEGTRSSAVFGLTHIDRMPIGDIAGTMISLIGSNPDLDFILRYCVDENEFIMDTRQMRQILEGISLSEPEVLKYIFEYINENIDAINVRF